MNQPNLSVASLLDVFANSLQTQLSRGHLEEILVSWAGGEDLAADDLIWWSWSLSIDPESRILTGAPLETWRALFGLSDDASADDLKNECLARISPAIEETARTRFGSEVTCTDPERVEPPPPEWTSVVLTVAQESNADLIIHLSVSADLEAALGGAVDEDETLLPNDLVAQAMTSSNSADILMQVEMPVSISLGRAKMRMRDLLHLANGSVVELNQELGDEVEIRVNNCVIAYGEVVAVDGNYAVRILRMAPARNATDLRGAVPGRVA